MVENDIKYIILIKEELENLISDIKMLIVLLVSVVAKLEAWTLEIK